MERASTILIVDDEPFGRDTLGLLLGTQGYHLAFASNGPEALSQAAHLRPDLILLDVMMPGMDGFEVCRRLREDPHLADVPIILVTALDDQASRLQGIQSGADDFISKPFNRIELRARVRTILRLNRYRRLMEEHEKFERLFKLSPDGLMIVAEDGTILLANPALRWMVGSEAPHQDETSALAGLSLWDLTDPDCLGQWTMHLHHAASDPAHAVSVETIIVRLDGTTFPAEVTIGHMAWNGTQAAQVSVRDCTQRKQAEAEIRQSRAELAQAYDATLIGWVQALDLRDKETEGHSLRVMEMTTRLAKALGIRGEALEHLRRGALLHDIGKLAIPDRILLKPGPLTEEERELMRKHPVYAYEWLQSIPYLRPALDIPYCHHERWDGSGYPRGLRGEAIPLPGRIFAVVDVWDALRSDRPYRPAWPEEAVREYIRSLAGRHFDPHIVEVFLACQGRGQTQEQEPEREPERELEQEGPEHERENHRSTIHRGNSGSIAPMSTSAAFR
ncbi:MAG: response regulator [Chloroflexaceae bacterium]|nr:response regulator [Chloroflexaceae bacterium]